jgi:hypothetical protein
VVRTKKRIDYEAVKRLNFTVVAYDSGIPQKSATAYVTVNVKNINDMDPVFSEVCLLFNSRSYKRPSMGCAWPVVISSLSIIPSIVQEKIEVMVIIFSA